ncbi:hypothetical protein SJ05684_b51780 (plasmid) [Sinorhizobium sojae CCBAU 05684]|uniref:Uncharacterized protein n=1 Tax=Sinorhizobium sojae CCBAU 05684 TaxID=716928 RepID=A0A249PJN6_9HYPH|nr:hypothetical protein SJ05684_b51780 [Sinorhizobium sojae CCBAU 05684]
MKVHSPNGLSDLITAHPIEIVGNADLARKKAKAPFFAPGRLIDRHDLHRGLSRLGDNERLTPRGLLNQPRQVRLRPVYINGLHRVSPWA